jgi:SAM-dependent methyltransferase
VERMDDYTLHHCPSCDVVFSDPMRGGDADWYEATYCVLQVAVDDRLRTYGRRALRGLPEHGRLLDVGCGAGAFVYHARARGLDAHGIDFSRKSIEAGRRRFGLTTLVPRSLADFRKEHAGPAFDIVTAFEVLEHVESPGAFLADIRELLEPDGLLVLSVPNPGRWPVRGFLDYPPHHLTRWTERPLRAIHENVGFEVVKVERTPVPESIQRFMGAGPRLLLYRLFNRQGRRALGEKTPAALGRLGSAARKWMDAALWVPTIVSLPLLYRWFEGYSLIVTSRKTADR